jgi:hypothetical protein
MSLPPIALMMEAVQTSETSVNSYQSTRRYNPEDSHFLYQTTRRNIPEDSHLHNSAVRTADLTNFHTALQVLSFIYCFTFWKALAELIFGAR